MAKSKDESHDLAVVSTEQYLALREEADELRALVDEYLEDGLSEQDLHLIKIPTGGGLQWELPNEQMASTFDGVILAIQQTRAYFPDEYSGGNSPPTCSSRDGKVGIGRPGGECALCSMAQWGSGRTGIGSACKERKILYILFPGETLPVRLSLPVTSFKHLRKYHIGLLNKRLPQHGVVTRFSLERIKSRSGISYSMIKLAQVGPIPAEMAERAKSYATTLKTALFPTAPETSTATHATVMDDDVPWGDDLRGEDLCP